jgi:putative ABC transport system permease protein
MRFAAGAFRGHRLRSGLSLLGVAIGVGAVVVLTSLGEGALRYVKQEFSALGTNLLIVIPGKTETAGATPAFGGVPNDLTLEDAKAVERHVRLVREVAPLSFGETDAAHGEYRRTVNVLGTTPAFLDVRESHVQIGRYLPETDMRRGSPVCVIGPKLQRELFGGRNPLGEILELGGERCRVIGVLAPRGVSMGVDLDESVHVPVARAMGLFDQTSLFRMFARVSSHEGIQAARKEVLALLEERHGGVEDVTILTQDAVLDTFSSILTALTATLAGIAAISLTVAGIGIMNVQLVSVSERVPEIGLLKALGARRGQILTVFLVEAALLSTAGGLLGLGAGYGACIVLRGLYPALPVSPPAWAVAGALGVSFGVGVAFGALPARRASRLEPVAALAGRR